MKTLFSIIAAVLLVLSAHGNAFAAGNGVERGDITFAANDSIPKGVEDRIETTMFENCDLRGAERISTSYLQSSYDEQLGANVYQIQYAVNLDHGSRLVMIHVTALLHLEGDPGRAIEIRNFSGPICRSIP